MILPLRVPTAQKDYMLMIPVSVEGTWWTEAHAVWMEAFALIGILVAGFAVEKDLYTQLPEYLRRKCDALMDETRRPMAAEAQTKLRFLLVFRFPYPHFDAVLADVNRLHFGNARTVWDDNGKPIKASRN